MPGRYLKIKLYKLKFDNVSWWSLCTISGVDRSIFIVLFMIILILIFEEQYNFSLIIFEVFSAFATNGMSTGASAFLNDYSKIVFIAGMFVGRLGPMTLALLISGSKKQTEFRFFQEKVRIG